MKQSVYIETSVISYLTARLTNDLVVSGNIAATNKWWNESREQFELFTSELVLDEASAGDLKAAGERRNVLQNLPLLQITAGAEKLAAMLLSATALPAKARRDALHVGIAAANGVNYLLTWNCRHLANAMLRARIEQVCRDQGFEPPVICTPLELEVLR